MIDEKGTRRLRFSFWLYPILLDNIRHRARAAEMTMSAWVRCVLMQAVVDATKAEDECKKNAE